MDYEHLCSLSDDELARCDIAELNLICAAGLPGSENLDIAACLHRLNQWTEYVHLGTCNALRDWSRFPEYADLSEARYRMVVLSMCLRKGVGLAYNYERLQQPYDATDSRDLFIHAVVMSGHLATCTISAVIFAAVGRRLGYPLKLVKTKRHLFCRWEDANERFNVEATNPGLHFDSDDYYRDWPFAWTAAEKDAESPSHRWLQNLSPRQELAFFIYLRGLCLLDNLRAAEATEACHFSYLLDNLEPEVETTWTAASLMHMSTQAALARGDLRPFENALCKPLKINGWPPNRYRLAKGQLDRIYRNRKAKVDTELCRCNFSQQLVYAT